jgi:hypothetical protein
MLGGFLKLFDCYILTSETEQESLSSPFYLLQGIKVMAFPYHLSFLGLLPMLLLSCSLLKNQVAAYPL